MEKNGGKNGKKKKKKKEKTERRTLAPKFTYGIMFLETKYKLELTVKIKLVLSKE